LIIIPACGSFYPVLSHCSQAFQDQFMAQVLTVLNSMPLASPPVDTSEQYLAASKLIAMMTDASQYAADNKLPQQLFVEGVAQVRYV
jgi:hypothetical protein